MSDNANGFVGVLGALLGAKNVDLKKFIDLHGDGELNTFERAKACFEIAPDSFGLVMRLSEDMKNNVELAKIIASGNITYLNFFSNDIKDNMDVAASVFLTNGDANGGVVTTDLQSKKDIVANMLNNRMFRNVFSQRIMDIVGDDKPNYYFENIYTKINAHNELSLSVFSKFSDDKSYVLDNIGSNGLLLELVSDRLKNDKDVVLLAIKQNHDAVKFVGEDLKKCVDKDINITMQNLDKYVPKQDEVEVEVRQEVKRKVKI